MSQRAVTRRGALGLMMGGAAGALVGCGGAGTANGQASGGSAGMASGGAGNGGSAGSAGGATGGSAGSASGGNAGSASGGSAGTGSGLQCRQGTAGCYITEDNILGPFYTPDAPFRTDLREGVSGQLLEISGTVYGCDCVTPLAGAIVDVWQADDSGAYDNVGYVLRARMRTDAQGRYEYRTIVPGRYLNGAQYRPAHIHYKVSHGQGAALTTQLYFEGDPYNAVDPWVKDSLVIALSEDQQPDGTPVLRGVFDVVLA